MNACVFIGPTISPAEARGVLNAVYLPPAAQGDVYLATRSRPQVIGIVDGYFESVPAVWHKEVLWALTNGIHVFGSSSMGALRAAELWQFGMEGVGRIFEWFRDGTIEDDDEVAVVHGPAEGGYAAVSEPMVNLRASLQRAEQAGVISPETAALLTAIAKDLHYSGRTYPAVLACGREEGASVAELAALERWLPAGRVDQKRLDALDLLSAIRARLADDPAPKRVTFFFERTVFWERLERSVVAQEKGSQMQASLAALVDELRLDPRSYTRARDAALLRELALAAAEREGVTAGDIPTADLLAEFRARRQLLGDGDFEQWLGENLLTRGEFEVLLLEEALLEAYRQRMLPRALRRLPDQLRLAGKLAPLLARARRKRALLAEHGLERPRPEDLGMSAEEVLEAYLGQLRQPEEGESAAEYDAVLRALCEDVPGLLRAALRELCYRQLASARCGRASRGTPA
jgi:hypothetical protein